MNLKYTVHILVLRATGKISPSIANEPEKERQPGSKRQRCPRLFAKGKHQENRPRKDRSLIFCEYVVATTRFRVGFKAPMSDSKEPRESGGLLFARSHDITQEVRVRVSLTNFCS